MIMDRALASGAPDQHKLFVNSRQDCHICDGSRTKAYQIIVAVTAIHEIASEGLGWISECILLPRYFVRLILLQEVFKFQTHGIRCRDSIIGPEYDPEVFEKPLKEVSGIRKRVLQRGRCGRSKVACCCRHSNDVLK